MKVALDQVQFVLAILREIERQNPFLFTELIREWQDDSKVDNCFFIRNNCQATLRQYIAENFNVEKFSNEDRYITIDDSNGRVVTFNDIQECFDLEHMANDIVENSLGEFYLGKFLPH